MSNILEIKDLHKTFGEKKVLTGINLSIPEGSIFGFLGANGAGKTTMMKIILGLIKKSSGKVLINGEEVKYGETKTNRFIGYLPDVPEFYGFMSPFEYLLLCANINEERKTKEEVTEKINDLLKLVGLENENKKIKGFSRGMKQRLGIAQALINDPKILLCDEPTSALDPIGRKEILDILMSVKSKTTILFSTHILSDVERICDSVAILNKGKIVVNGNLSYLKEINMSKEIILELGEKDSKRFLNDFKDKDIIDLVNISMNTYHIKTRDIKITQELLFSYFSENKIYPHKFEISEPKIEDIFWEVIK